MRYAVIDREGDKDSLAYLVGNQEVAEQLCETWGVVVAVKAGCPLKTKNSIPVEDDGTEETAMALLESIKPWMGETVYRW